MHGHEGVTVTGSASVDVEPDIVVADMGVDVRDDDVSTALRAAEAALEEMRAALLSRGVERPDMRTAQTSIWRQDRTDDSGAVVGTTVHVRLGLQVTLRDTATAGELVHAALAAAGPVAQMNGLSFAVSDATSALAQARDVAFDEALAAAQRYAARAGRILGQVVAVVEEPSGSPVLPRALKAGAEMALASLPVEPGVQAVSASVRVTWSFAG